MAFLDFAGSLEVPRSSALISGMARAPPRRRRARHTSSPAYLPRSRPRGSFAKCAREDALTLSRVTHLYQLRGHLMGCRKSRQCMHLLPLVAACRRWRLDDDFQRHFWIFLARSRSSNRQRSFREWRARRRVGAAPVIPLPQHISHALDRAAPSQNVRAKMLWH